VVKCHYSYETPEKYYFIMDYLPNGEMF
jgi:serine/threonine protein kinase